MSKPFSLEDGIKKLEGIEAYFQRPDMKLEEAIEHHKEALKTAKEILGYLEKAESTIQQIDIQAALAAGEND